jgi:hypothetical protein
MKVEKAGLRLKQDVFRFNTCGKINFFLRLRFNFWGRLHSLQTFPDFPLFNKVLI